MKRMNPSKERIYELVFNETSKGRDPHTTAAAITEVIITPALMPMDLIHKAGEPDTRIHEAAHAESHDRAWGYGR